MKYECKFIINGKGFKQTVDADNETMAKQKVLASINFVSCDVIKLPNNKELDNIFGVFGQIFK